MDVGVFLGGFGFKVYGIALNVDSFDGADEFASAASYAKLCMDFRYGQPTLKRYHMNSLHLTMLGACTATGAVYINHADILIEYYMTGLGNMLLLYC